MKDKNILVFTLLSIIILMSCNLTGNQPTSQPENLPQATRANTQTPAPTADLPTSTEQAESEPTETPMESTTEAPAPPPEMSDLVLLPDLVSNGVLQLDGIDAQMDETAGEVLTIQVTNPGSEPITVTVPCGLIFTPQDDELQPLIVIQEVTELIQPGDSAELVPLVACADLESGTPEIGAGYTIGSFAEGDLLALAECMCQSDADFSVESFELVNAQFAIWTISNGDLFSTMPDMENSPLADLMGDEYGSVEEFEAAWEAMSGVFAEMSKAWFERCNLDVPITTPGSP